MKDAVQQPTDVEDIFRLTPTQEGMLYHILDAEGAGTHTTQMRCDLIGALDAAALQRAFEDLTAGAPALRSAVHWRGLDHPVQVVFRDGPTDFQVVASERAAADETAHVQATSAFDPSALPLSRIRLLRLSETHHRIVWTHLDLQFDGWSLAILLDTVFTRYADIVAGRAERPLPPLPSARRALSALSAADTSASESYWSRHLSGAEPTPLPFGADERGLGGEHVLLQHTLDLATAGRLRTTAERLGVSFASLISVAWGLLLCRYAGTAEATFGSVVSGRTADVAEIDRVVGVLINTVPTRIRLEPDMTIGDLVRRVHADMAERLPHETLSLSRIQRAAGLTVGSPFLRTAVIVENYPGNDHLGANAGLTVRDIRNEERLPYPVTVFVTPSVRPLIEFSVDSASLSAAEAQRILDTFVTLLMQVVPAIEKSVSHALDILSPRDVADIAEWNRTRTPADRAGAVHTLFFDEVERSSLSPAVATEDVVLSYRELEERIDALAARLPAAGVHAEGRVAVLCERSAELVIAFYATLRAGAAFVPLDPGLPDERLAWIAEDAGVSVILSDSGLLARAERLGPGAAVLLVDSETPEQQPRFDPPPVRPDQAAYVLYTSGSTGRPKGVVVSHAAIRNRILWMQETFSLTADDVVLQKTPLSFDVSIWEFLWPLAFGGRLVVAPPESHTDPDRIAALIRRHGVTLIHFVPSMLRAFLDAAPEDARFPSVRAWFASGEALDRGVVDALHAHSDARLHNLYGPTEAAIDVTWHPTTQNATTGRIPIGRPIANTGIRIVDDTMAELPVGGVGELCITGANVARGYIGRPGLTAERFLADPFAAEPGARLYRTGDRARLRADGEIEYLGRDDDQAKVNGVRLELGEVEVALRSHPAVRDAAVLVQRSATTQLVAFVTGMDPLDQSALRRHLAASLPASAIPSRFLPVEHIPLGRSGKADRARLAVLADEAAVSLSTVARPLSPREQEVAAVWTEVLGIDRFGPETSFFEAGGHSLSAILVINRLRATCGTDLTLRRFLEEPTLAGVALALGSEEVVPARPRVESDAAPSGPVQATSAQRALWFHWRMDRDSTSYTLASAIRLQGHLDVERFRRAVRVVTARHDALRATFSATDGAVLMHVRDDASPLVEIVEPAAHTPLEQLLADYMAAPFDLENGPLWRIRVVSSSSLDHVVSLVVHHIVSDAWSMQILVADLVEAYADAAGYERRGPAAGLFGWCEDQAALSTSPDRARRVAQAAQALESVPARLALPELTRPRFPGPARSVVSTMSDAGATDLRACAVREQTTPFTVALAAWSLTLARLTGQSKLAVGTPFAGRTDGRHDSTIGYLVTMLVMPMRIREDDDFARLLARTKEASRAVLDAADVPFEDLVAVTARQRSVDRHPLFGTTFAYEYVPAALPEPPGLRVLTEYADSVIDRNDTAFDLTMTLIDDGTKISVRLDYNGSLYAGDVADELVETFVAILADGVVRPEVRAVDIGTSPDSPDLDDDFEFGLLLEGR
ncbi:amino acid adenylation domain-containing protein [Leifsonia shinshuensis]|uniref:non-ribosomal peptide synthetase n=1 Tax=Leifsonia shinshuensis TaxID=150026 RepID=UPI001F509BF4|nr:non-ribosomal peptide synthetase [Leifsonia shinshuensis]MCI0158115.1 amino acid adenylation domain-containing protein [Leifsonia shinshuensis]